MTREEWDDLEVGDQVQYRPIRSLVSYPVRTILARNGTRLLMTCGPKNDTTQELNAEECPRWHIISKKNPLEWVG